MTSVGLNNPADMMVDQMLAGEDADFRDRWRERLSVSMDVTVPGLVDAAIASTTRPDGKMDPVRLAILAEEGAGQPSFRALRGIRYRILAATLGSTEQRALALSGDASVQALCIADRSVQISHGDDTTIVTGRVPGVPLAAEAALLYLVVFEEQERRCYLVRPGAPGVTIEDCPPDGSGDVVLADVKLVKASRLGGSVTELEQQLALINVLDGLEALAAGQGILREAVTVAKSRPAGAGTGFDDQDTQFRLAAHQARLVIGAGYRAALYRKLRAAAITPVEGAIAKLWLSVCAEGSARVAQLAGLAPARTWVETQMLADAMRGNLLRDTIAATVDGR